MSVQCLARTSGREIDAGRPKAGGRRASVGRDARVHREIAGRAADHAVRAQQSFVAEATLLQHARRARVGREDDALDSHEAVLGERPLSDGRACIIYGRLLEKRDVRRVYDELEDKYGAFCAILPARQEAGSTQTQVAEPMGTIASAVSQLEASLSSEKHSLSLAASRKYAVACGKRLVISFS